MDSDLYLFYIYYFSTRPTIPYVIVIQVLRPEYNLKETIFF